MTTRSSMADLILRTRRKIADPASVNQHFSDQEIQDRLDEYHRDDIRYEVLQIAPSIVNTNNTQQSAETIFADYYSAYSDWESDVVLQGQNAQGLPWTVLTPAASDYIVGHWQFELNVFNTGIVPGQRPPVFATGKIYDLNGAAADLLEDWAATLASKYDVTVDGQSLRRSQLMEMKLKMADRLRRLAKPRSAKMRRNDVQPANNTRRMRLFDDDDVIKRT